MVAVYTDTPSLETEEAMPEEKKTKTEKKSAPKKKEAKAPELSPELLKRLTGC